MVEQIHERAQKLKNNKQLRKVVRAARIDMREQVYEMIAEHVTFKPLPFCRM